MNQTTGAQYHKYLQHAVIDVIKYYGQQHQTLHCGPAGQAQRDECTVSV